MFAQDVDGLAEALQATETTAWDYGRAGIILAVALLVARLLRFGIGRLWGRNGSNSMLADLLGRVVAYVVAIFGLVYALDTLGVAIGPLLGALGVAGIALAFALQDLVENFVAGVTLQMSRPFEAEDEVTIAEQVGRVSRVDIRSVSLETPEGETVILPNVDVIKNPIINHTRVGYRRSAVGVGVAYGSDLDVVRQVLLAAAESVDEVFADPPPQVLAVGFGESSIDFEILMWHRSSLLDEMEAKNDVILAVDKALAEAGITIPFPQRTVHVESHVGHPV